MFALLPIPLSRKIDMSRTAFESSPNAKPEHNLALLIDVAPCRAGARARKLEFTR